MTRRIARDIGLLAVLALSILAAAPEAAAQQASKLHRIGILSLSEPTQEFYQVLPDELRGLGYNVGRDLVIETPYARGDASRLPALAAELVRSKVDAILAFGPEAPLKAAVAATRTIPIVMVAINYDPIAKGYVAALARPGGNVTGVLSRQPELAAKQIELLKQVVPDASRLSVLWDALSAEQFGVAEDTVRSLGMTLLSMKLQDPPYDFERAIQAAADGRAQALLVLSSPHFTAHGTRIAAQALKDRLPTAFTFPDYVRAGGLMSYGPDYTGMYRRAAAYIDKLLKGAEAGELPIEQPTAYRLIVNLKTAKVLGLAIPQSVLGRADEVIE